MTLLIMKVHRGREPNDRRIFIPVWLLIQPLAEGIKTYSWVAYRTQATQLDEADACAWLLRVADDDGGGDYWLYSSVPV